MTKICSLDWPFPIVHLPFLLTGGIIEKTAGGRISMFSTEKRCRYGANQLTDVICQFRFPEILSIEANMPVDFQEAIREQYPIFQRRMEIPAPKITGQPGQFRLENQPGTINCQFSSLDHIWRINLTSRFISLSCSQYTCWEDFAAHMD